jgi:3-oxoacyl-[acyl-carrier-protein] synthase-3
MDTSDEWIRERSGIETRYFVEQGTTTSDLGAAAARKALEDAGIAKEEIDYIVFATMTPDHYFPGCGGILEDKLGLSNVPALDIRQQCTGFIYGLQSPTRRGGSLRERWWRASPRPRRRSAGRVR